MNEKRRALLVVAASETGLVEEIRRACAALGIDQDTLRQLEADGLLRTEHGRATLRFDLVDRLFQERLRRDVAELAETVTRSTEGRPAEVHPFARSKPGGAPRTARRPLRPSRPSSCLGAREREELRGVLAHLAGEGMAREPHPRALAFAGLADLDLQAGRWAEAEREAEEALRVEGTLGDHAEWSALLPLARLDALRGRGEKCRFRVARMLELSRKLGFPPSDEHVLLGLLALTERQAHVAIRELETAARLRPDEPLPLHADADLAEAYVREGLPKRTEACLGRLDAHARAASCGAARAACARVRGLLAETGFEHEFKRALAVYKRSPIPFERARTDLCYGERLRRARRRAAARDLLHSALATFDALAAAPWAERTRSEMEASGEHCREAVGDAALALTPRELEIARLVARGATNREVAAELFLSPKTVEAHLSQVYGKLGLRSRTALAALLVSLGDR